MRHLEDDRVSFPPSQDCFMLTPCSEPPSPTLSDSAILDSLEEDGFDLSSHREQRMEELHQEVRRLKTLQESEHGRMVVYGDEKKLIERMA